MNPLSVNRRDIGSVSKREERAMERISKRNLRKERQKPGYRMDEKNQYDPSAEHSGKCYSHEDCAKKASFRRKRKRPPIRKEVLPNRVVTISDRDKLINPGKITKDEMGVEYGRTDVVAKKDRDPDKVSTTVDEKGNVKTIEEYEPSIEEAERKGELTVEGGKIVSKEGEVDKETEEKMKKLSEEGSYVNYQPTVERKKETTGKRAYKARKKDYKPLAGMTKTKESFRLTDPETGEEVAPYRTKRSETLTTRGRRGKGRTMELKYTGGEGAGASETGTITSRRGKTREVDAERLKKKMGRTEERFERRIDRQGRRFKVRRDPQSVEDRRAARKFDREEAKLDRQKKRKKRRGSNTQNPKQNKAPLKYRLKALLSR